MTGTVLETAAPTTRTAPSTRDAPPGSRSTTRTSRATWIAGVVLLCVYVALSFTVDLRGTMLADSGGKLATVRAMADGGGLDPDVGYWAAELDADGHLHPLHYTARIGDTYVQATTVPMLYAALPLYEVGGTRLALLLPMLGGVACALAARALARRLGAAHGTAWIAFWAVGLLTPVVVYATSFWEHTLGLAAMLWAVVLALDTIRSADGWGRPLLVGVLFGVAASMRTEALVYFAVIAVTMCVVAAANDRRRRAVVVGCVAGAGLLAVLVLNDVIERLTVGGSIRSSRVTGTAGNAAAEAVDRVDAVLTSLSGINGFDPGVDALMGGLLVFMVACAVVLGRRPSTRVVAVGCAVLAGALYVVRFGNGLGFVPGLLIACPLAVGGLVTAWRASSTRLVTVMVLLPLPLIWLTQYVDTQRIQWGYRFGLTTGIVLSVIAIVALASDRAVLGMLLVLSLMVCGFGVVFVGDRTQSISEEMRTLVARGDEVLISVEPHLFRDGGDYYRPDRLWLTAANGHDLDAAVNVANRAGARQLAIVTRPGVDLPQRIGEFRRSGDGTPDDAEALHQIVEYRLP